MKFRLLGPLEVMTNGAAVTVGGRKPRLLLTRLLVDAGRVVSADALVETLWGKQVPANSAGALQVHVSRLRAALGEGVIVTRSPGYMARVDPDDLDLEVCERLIGEGRRALQADAPGLAAAKFHEADRLFRGRPLDSFDDEEFARPTVTRFEELRIGAIEDRMEAELASGRHREMVPELEELVDSHPWRERLWGQLMLALYRAGRQAEALRSFRRASDVLGEQLGIEPGPELRSLEDRILGQDPALWWQPPGAASAPGAGEVGLLMWEWKSGTDSSGEAAVHQLIGESMEASAGSPIPGPGGVTGYAFDDPALVVAAATELVTALTRSGRQMLVGGALHTGEITERGGRPAGLAQHRCLRLLRAGHGGQLLVSEAGAAWLDPGLPADMDLVDLGRHRLPGVTGPETIRQLRAPGWKEHFPPLRSMAMAASNLPVQLTTFLGREVELLEVGKLVDEHRLVTLTGPGGAGKTRLALQIAADRVGTQPDGVWLVELAALNDADQVLKAAAVALGIAENPDRPLLTGLIERLQAAEPLLVFDNCEHLIDPTAELIDHLLRASPEARVLATSRQALGVAGEHVWPVPTLPIPDPERIPEASELLRYDAVRLFVERAGEVRPDFTLDQDNAAAVARICRRLDGLPLAVELAAARVRSLSPQEIAERLERALDVLAPGARTALPRQRTLEATLDWSHQLLDSDEQVLYRRLGIFLGGCTLEAAERVCCQPPLNPTAVLDLLDQLVSKSLLTVTATAPTRYLMLETVRGHAAGRLELSGEGPMLAEVQARHFLDLAHQAEAAGRGALQKEWFDRLEADHDNLRRAISHWGETIEAVDLAAALSYFWISRGHLREGWNVLSELRDSVRSMPIGLEARADLAAGGLAFKLKDLDTAEVLLRRALELGVGMGEHRITAEAHSYRGAVAGTRRQWKECETEVTAAVADYRLVGDEWGMARVWATWRSWPTPSAMSTGRESPPRKLSPPSAASATIDGPPSWPTTSDR